MRPWDRWDKGSEASWLREVLDRLGYNVTRELVDAFEVRKEWTSHEQLEPVLSVWRPGPIPGSHPARGGAMLEFETVEIDGIPANHGQVRITWLSASGNARVWVEAPYGVDRPYEMFGGVSRRDLTFSRPLSARPRAATEQETPGAEDAVPHCRMQWEEVLRKPVRDAWLREHLEWLGYEITQTTLLAFEVRWPWPVRPGDYEGPIPWSTFHVEAVGRHDHTPLRPLRREEERAVRIDGGLSVRHNGLHMTHDLAFDVEVDAQEGLNVW